MKDIAILKSEIQALGFTPENGESNVWIKNYVDNTYPIRIKIGLTPAESNVDYGPLIKCGRRTTMNFKDNESVVVLECISRLLEQGYKPDSIILEKPYKVGHGDKYLDILVKKGNKAFMMIECKTFGLQYDNELQKLMNIDGGQLFSYWLQDRDARILVLYTSKVENGQIHSKYTALETNILSGSNLLEVHGSWNKEVFEVGVFDAEPYKLKERRLRVRDLEDMVASDGGRIFNAFAEILRRNVISDKPNAFNKIFNLFICKVQDEEKEDPDALLEFQWLEEENAETVMNRLNDLYKRGLKDYLQMDVADHSVQELEHSLVSLSNSDRSQLLRIFNELRLYKNNEFAFVEVYDRKTFIQNAEIVKDVVRLLQKKRLRYTHKQPFMGDFFERLLNTSVKQESGQFFTPIPIARFICDSLPIEDIINKKIAGGDPKFLPYMIDYASGSGHFLTEGMERIDHVLQQINTSKINRTQRANFNAWKENYMWASEFVYGIEKDYRLAKTTKVSCFLNGDGEANVIRADGLDHFELSEEYRENGGILSRSGSGVYDKDNPVFDIVVANPPYSVRQCKMTVKHGELSFDLFDRLGNDSKEIQCLFVERTKQLMKPGAVAGVIFPISILSNGGIEEDARDLLLKYFNIKGLVALKDLTFMKTNTSTVILFLERRSNMVWKAANELVLRFFSNWQDTTINNIPNAISLYVKEVWGISLQEYLTMMQELDNQGDHRLFKEHSEEFKKQKEIKELIKSKKFLGLELSEQQELLNERFKNHLFKQETDRILHYVLARGQQVVLVNAPKENEAQKQFLGYEFKERAGYEGLLPLPDGSSLYDENRRDNPEKVNTIIQANFTEQPIKIPKKLNEFVSIHPLTSLLTFNQVKFDKSISTSVKREVVSKWPIVRIGDLTTFIKRGPTPKYAKEGNISIIKSGQARGWYNFDLSQSYYWESTAKIDPERLLVKGDLLVNSTGVGTAGRVTLFNLEGGFTVDSHVTILRINEAKASADYVLAALGAIGFKNIEKLARGQSGQVELSPESIKNIEIPLPPLEQQQVIVRRLSRIKNLKELRLKKIDELNEIVEQRVWRVLQNPSGNKKKISELFQVNPSKKEVASFGLRDEDYVTFLPMASVSEDGRIIERKNKMLNEVKSGYTYFREGDLLFAKITPCMENGKGAIAEKLTNGIGFGSTEFHVLRSKGKMDPKLLYKLIQQKKFRIAAEPHMTGMAGQRRVPKSYLENYEVSMPTDKEKEELIKLISDTQKEIGKHEVSMERLSLLEDQYLEIM